MPDAQDAFPDNPNESLSATQSGAAAEGFNQYRAHDASAVAPSDASIAAIAGVWSGTAGYGAGNLQTGAILDVENLSTNVNISDDGSFTGTAQGSGCSFSGRLSVTPSTNPGHIMYQSASTTFTGCSFAPYNGTFKMGFNYTIASNNLTYSVASTINTNTMISMSGNMHR